MKRVLYALWGAINHRYVLANYLSNPVSRIDGVLSIDPAALSAKVLVLDFDGVLAAHGEPYPDPEVSQWLDRCLEYFGTDRVFILTNKPTQVRREYFSAKGIAWLASTRKKPYPDGLLEVARMASIPVEELILVDDRLLTGVLAAVSVGAQVLYVTRPKVNFRKRPIQESFFMLLRLFERLMVRIVGYQNK